jgi:hypothetical protein
MPCPKITDAEMALMEAIVAAPEAWSMVEALEAAGHERGTLAVLEEKLLIEPWKRVDGLAVTLTPWGKFCRKVELRERRGLVRKPKVRNGHAVLRKDGNPVMVKKPDLIPYWKPDGWGSDKTTRAADRRREYRAPMPELVPDPRPGPEFMIDPVSEEPVALFARLFDGTPVEGVKVVIDKRLKAPRQARSRSGKRLAGGVGR